MSVITPKATSLSRNKPVAIVGLVVLALAAALAVIRFAPGHLGTGLFGSGANGDQATLASALAKTKLGADFLQMIGQRSPGERTAGELADTKARKLAAVAPHQRALPKVRAPAAPLENVVPTIFESPVVSAAPDLIPPVAELLPSALAANIPPALGYSPLGGGGGVILPPVISSPTPVTPPADVPPTVTPAVPEPGTWMLMLVGFGAAGTAMRRRRKLELQLARITPAR